MDLIFLHAKPYLMPAFLVFAGFVPSIIWLFYYLRKDCHPEPKSLIARAMAAGILVAPVAVGAQLVFTKIAAAIFPSLTISSSAIFFLWAALVEELVKFLAIKYTILHNPAFDEPTDAMEYMISAALGFAAIENILVLFNAYGMPDGLGQAMQIWLLRFAGATLLHAVSSAIVGYFLAVSWFYQHHSRKLIVAGITFATLGHFLFNVALTNGQKLLPTLPGLGGVTYSSITLVVLVIIVSILFTKTRKKMNCDLSTT